MLHRFFVPDRDRDGAPVDPGPVIASIVAELGGATTYPARGVWDGGYEKTIILEHVGELESWQVRSYMLRIARNLNQEAVLHQALPVDSLCLTREELEGRPVAVA